MTGRRGLRRFSVLLVTLVLSTSSGAIAQIRHDSTGQAVDDERAPGAMGLSPEEARERREEEREERMRRERARQERLRQERLRQERLRREREERERERLEQERQERIRRERAERRRREREERERLEREEEARLERERRARAERRRRQREEREAREEEERLEREREERAERARERREERERLEQERQQRAAREARLARAEQERAQRERERAVRLRQQREAEELEARQEQERQDQRRRRPRATDPQEQDDEGDEDDVDEEPADEEAEEEDAEDSPSPPPATASRDRGEDETEESDGDGWADEDAPDAEDDDDAGGDETDSDDPETADESPRARRTRRRGESARARGPGEPRPTRSRRDRGDEDRDDDDDDRDDDDGDDDDRDDDDDSIPITFGGSSTLIFERRANNGDDDPTDDNYYDGILRAQAALEIGRVRLSTRVDGALFLDNPEGADRRNDIRPERVLLEGDTDLGPLTLRAAAGDFYAQIGRGLILSLRRVDEIGIDTALRGGRIEVGGRDGGWNLQVMGGLANPANLDNQRLLHVEDPNDFIGGTRVEARLEGATLALHGAWARVGEAADEELGADQTWAFGGEVETTLRDVTMAVELDWQARRRSGEDERGFAIYGTASAPIGPLTLLAELKHYSEFEVMRGSIPTSGSAAFAYSAPPTAERVDQEVLDNTDVTGGRLQGDLAAGDATTLTLSGGLFYNRFYDRWFSHVFGGGDHRWTSGASLALHGGYRREWDVENGDLTRAIAHGEADATIPVTRDWSAHGTVRHESHVEVIADERLVYHRGTATLELDYRHQISFTGGFEWDTHGQSPDAPQTFGFGLVTWSPNDIVSLRLLAGTQRGGLKCLAGTCRVYPPFAGLRMDLSVRF
ncbi:MAG: hypothetical protein IT379_26075 [Deltaproteobacteria bacterium]|nr:hypothetical protein [Deltaproteobacteria bacterium]